MALAEVTSTVTSVSEILAPIGGIGLILMSFWIIYRTKSAYLIRRRMVRFLTGEVQGEEDVRKFLEEQDILMVFRAATRVQAESMKQVKAAIAWIQNRELPLSLVARSGRFVDLQSLTVQRGSYAGQNSCIAATIVVMCLGVFMAIPMVLSEILITVKTTKHSYAVTTEAARPVRQLLGFFPLKDEQRRNLPVDLCGLPAAEASAKTSLPSDDVSVLCMLMTSHEGGAYVAEGVSNQRIVFFVFSLVFFVFAYFPFRESIAIMSSIELCKRLSI